MQHFRDETTLDVLSADELAPKSTRCQYREDIRLLRGRDSRVGSVTVNCHGSLVQLFRRMVSIIMGRRARAQAVDDGPRSSGMNRKELSKMLNFLKYHSGPQSRDFPAQKSLHKDALLKYESLPANHKAGLLTRL